VEASALQAPATLAHPRVLIGTPLLRFRSDEQLLALFRAGHDEAFRAIHDRYHKRLFAYARQMLPAAQDAEDALQDVFVRAYSGLRASDRELALRAWLFRVAHNRCIDELRRPAPPPPEVLHMARSTVYDPLVEVDLRESLRRLIADVRRLPDQQRSALLMRELGGVSYADVAASLGISVGAVKSLLVRARIALAQAADARDTACSEIRDELVGAHERGVRPNAIARRHIRDCTGCRSFRRELRGVTRQLAALAPALGPFGALAKALGFSGGAGSGATAGGATAGGGAAVAGGSGAAASASGLALGVNHVATLIAAAVATAGGAVEIQHTIITPTRHPAHVRTAAPRSQRGSPLNPGATSGAVDSVEPAATAAAAVAVAVATETTAAKPRAAGTTKHGTFKTQSPNASNTQGAAGIGPATGTDGSSTAPGTGAGTGLTTAPGVTGTTETVGSNGSPSCSSTTGDGSPSGTSSGSTQPSGDSTGTSSSGSQPSGSTPSSTGSSGSGTGSSTTSSSTSTSSTSSTSSSSGSASSSSSSSSSGSDPSSSSSSSTCPSSSSSGSGSSTTPPA
jgi:RNA polymerase sigma factor (sigma-70 family)